MSIYQCLVRRKTSIGTHGFGKAAMLVCTGSTILEARGCGLVSLFLRGNTGPLLRSCSNGGLFSCLGVRSVMLLRCVGGG